MSGIEHYRSRIEAVKLSVEGLVYSGIDASDVIRESVLELQSDFERTNNKEFLIQALIQIQAYMEMGFPYADNGETFDNILCLLELNRDIMYPKKFYDKKELKITKNAIRRVIGKWPRTKGRTMSLDDMVNEIIKNCLEGNYGIYDYVCPMGNNSKIKKIQVVIKQKEMYLYHYDKKIYYFLKEEENTNAKNCCNR